MFHSPPISCAAMLARISHLHCMFLLVHGFDCTRSRVISLITTRSLRTAAHTILSHVYLVFAPKMQAAPPPSSSSPSPRSLPAWSTNANPTPLSFPQIPQPRAPPSIQNAIGSIGIATVISLQAFTYCTPLAAHASPTHGFPPLAYVGSLRSPQAPSTQYEQVAPGVYRPPPRAPPPAAGPSVSQQAAQLLQLLETARTATKQGEYDNALALYTQGVQQYSDLALSEYARLGRALLLYQLGFASQALIELEDSEVAMKGYAEVHAALAAVLYAGMRGCKRGARDDCTRGNCTRGNCTKEEQ